MPGTIDCVSCGEEIPEGRRSANPSATRCIECQKFWETEKFHR
ncbi:TraR/DksA C4-type zinc finger protein [Rhizobium sp. CC-YZS058]|nr:TraR/DksA C4-type zinc finger protein [Rhizobium sp. CC-YZS058]MEA3533710.1 TraR/DksA C4-type zinc finger protein [Rhizobium sp. CC-YZS058]